jgi:hypothetical protein
MKIWIQLLLLLLTLFPSTLSSDNNSAARQILLEVYPQWYSKDDMTIQGNIGITKIYQNSDWITHYAKPSVTYAISHNLALHGGLGYYYTNNNIIDDIREWRPFVGMSHFSNLTDKLGISSYFRTEERYRSTFDSNNKSKTTRLRLRFRNTYKLNPLSVPHSWHKITLDLEGFKSYTSDTVIEPTYDYQTRVSLGLERSLTGNKKLRFEIAWKYATQPINILDSSLHTVFFKIQYFPTWGSQLGNRLFDRGIDE